MHSNLYHVARLQWLASHLYLLLSAGVVTEDSSEQMEPMDLAALGR